MGVRHRRRYNERARQQGVRLFKLAQPRQHNTVIGQGFGVIGAEPDGVAQHIGSGRQIAVSKQERRQPDLVFSAFGFCRADLVDHRHLRLDGIGEPSGAILRQRRGALCLEILRCVRQIYRSQNICTAYR